jgi:hypothetical protein
MMGKLGAIVNVTFVELPFPTAFPAITVNVTEERIALGVPLITQVLGWMLSPVGRLDVVEQDVTPEPLLLRVVGVIVMGTSHCPDVPKEPE